MAAVQDSNIGNLSISDFSETIQQVSHTGTETTDVTHGVHKVNSEIIKNQQKTSTASSVDPSPLKKASTSLQSFRFQVKLDNGFFTVALKNDLIRNLYEYLYNLPADSFIPSFDGFGLRYGKIWFSPENEKSCIWLKQSLLDINEKAANDFKFCIQPYCLKQYKICLNIPMNPNESLTTSDVLHRLDFQNPAFLINLWKVISVKANTAKSRLIFCSADHDSFELLKKQKFRIYYGFQKVLVRELPQNVSAKPKTDSS